MKQVEIFWILYRSNLEEFIQRNPWIKIAHDIYQTDRALRIFYEIK